MNQTPILRRAPGGPARRGNRWTFHPCAKPAHPRWDRTAVRPTVEQLESRCLLSTNVLTYHNDPIRTGANLTATTLRADSVGKPGSFGKLFDYPVDGPVYAQPLYMPNVKLTNGSVHNIVFVATENDSVYAFDANGGGQLWYTHLL